MFKVKYKRENVISVIAVTKGGNTLFFFQYSSNFCEWKTWSLEETTTLKKRELIYLKVCLLSFFSVV